ncbi:MAG: hypothetical protein ACXVJD_00435 [Mucilaginibacter sp.]
MEPYEATTQPDNPEKKKQWVHPEIEVICTNDILGGLIPRTESYVIPIISFPNPGYLS